MSVIVRVLTVSVIITLMSFNTCFSQTTEIHYDSGFTWRAYNGSDQPICTSKLCHYYPMMEWDPYYTEATIWKGDSDQADYASAFLNLRIIFPPGYNVNDPSKKYPVIIMLHGAGESGRAWEGNFEYSAGDPMFDNNSNALKNGGDEHQLAVRNGTFPGIVVFPQASFSGAWDDPYSTELTQNEKFLVSLIEDYLVPHYHADINRITMHGLSAGATGTWGFAQKRPDLFASILTMSGVPYDVDDAKSKLVTTPIRMFQGGLDTNPRPFSSQDVVAAFEADGGTPTLFLYPELAHDTWERAYSEPDFFSWIIASDKRNPYVFGNKSVVCPGVDTVRIGFSANMKSYQWMWNDIKIPAENGRYINVVDPGSYKVKFTRQNDETDESYAVNIGLKDGCEIVAGTNDQSLEVLSPYLYPNPGSDRVYLANIRNEELKAVQIVTSSGQSISVPVEVSADGKAELNISALEPGVYVVRTSSVSLRLLKRQ